MRTDAPNATKSKSDTFLLYTLEEKIDDDNYRELQRRLRSSAYSTTVVIDLSKVSSLTSAGLGALISLIEYAQEAKRRLYLMNPSATVLILINSTGFSEFFPIIKDLSEIGR